MSSTSFLLAAGLVCSICAVLVFVLPLLTEVIEQRRFRRELDEQDRAGSVAGADIEKAGVMASRTTNKSLAEVRSRSVKF
jgi:hypothetical protein